jgi:proteasome lid subunit RPN8/RPN11
LVKHTHPSHPDYPALSDARTKMQELAVFINIQKKEAENIYEVIAIQDKLIGKFEVHAPMHPLC